ncbi:response regulator transcription factor [Streptomyces sp. NPDC046862]|uniref:response regulator transcription factor n=1 Tax=Streptomyces sp. NPDC046862 TaxID=3154603 RepID=UPI003451126E
MEKRLLKILVAEDMDMVRGALVALLELEEDLKVVATIDSGEQIAPAARKWRPDVAIIDVGLPELDGLSAAELLHREVPGCRTLILTGLGRPAILRRAMAAHVSGFLLKDSPSEGLARAVRDVAAGRRVVDPQLAMSAWDIGENPLSERETEVLWLASQGAEATEIAAKLHLSAGTVRNYLTTVVLKLNARNRLDAVRIAVEAGWLI